ncbi:MAG: putative zinc-binding protein [Promethearchaeati archaeon]
MRELEEKFENIILIPCSGSEYHGELARRVAISLAEKSEISMLASMTCSTIFLKNVLLEKEQLVEISKNHLKNSFVVIINGCHTSCSSQIYEHLGISPDLIISVQDVIPKQRINFNDINSFKNQRKLSEIKTEDIQKVVDHVIRQLENRGLDIETIKT